MSVYGVHKFLHNCLHEPAFRALAINDPESAMAGLPLSDDEQNALRCGNVAWLYEHGVHAFLLSFLTRWEIFGLNIDIYSQRIRDARDWRKA